MGLGHETDLKYFDENGYTVQYIGLHKNLYWVFNFYILSSALKNWHIFCGFILVSYWSFLGEPLTNFLEYKQMWNKNSQNHL
jgi:hypothetical protein